MIPVISKKSSKKIKLIAIAQIVTDVIVDEYAIGRELYKHAEYIPNSAIQSTLNHHFPSTEILFNYMAGPHHLCCKIQIKDLFGPNIKNWEHNRPADMVRCEDIARYFYNSKKQMETMIYLTYNNTKECFEVIDGIHRLTSLKIIYDANSQPFNVSCPGDFGSNNDADWLYDQYIPVNIRFNTPKGEIIELFETLNKSQVVPKLYIKDTNKDKRRIIETIVNDWQEKYKPNFVTSAEPNYGHTTRNKFVDLLDNVYDKYNLDETGEPKLRQLLEDANNKLAKEIPSKISVTMRVKCKESGCFLFLLKNDKLEKLIYRL